MNESKTLIHCIVNESFSLPKIKIMGETQKEILSSVAKAINEGSTIQDVFKLIGKAIIVDKIRIKLNEHDKVEIYLEESEVDDKRLNLQPLEKTIYLFYLLHLDDEPIANKKLSDNKAELSCIYKNIGNKDESTSDEKIDKLINTVETKLLSENCSHINKKIKDKIKDNEVSELFSISEKTNKDGYKCRIINLTKDKVSWGERVKEKLLK